MTLKNKNSSARQYWIIFIGSTFLVLFFILQNYFISLYFEKEFQLYKDSVYQFAYVYAWVLFTPVIIYFSTRFKLEQGRLLKNLPMHILVAIVVALLHRVIFTLSFLYLTAPKKLKYENVESLIGKIIGGSFDGFVVYWLILGAYLSFAYYREYKTQQLKAAQLETQLAHAQVQALRMQMQPHFLFNTLHAISSLIDEDVQQARKMLARLSDLLRLTLDNIGVQKVTLEAELDFLKKYLEIEQTRFSDRLSIQYEIEPELLDQKIPNLILQPLVENALKHGIAPSSRGGKIRISAGLEETHLILCVQDDGIGTNFPVDQLFGKGLGLSSVKMRLQQMYGKHASIEVENLNSGFSVCIRLPMAKDDR